MSSESDHESSGSDDFPWSEQEQEKIVMLTRVLRQFIYHQDYFHLNEIQTKQMIRRAISNFFDLENEDEELLQSKMDVVAEHLFPPFGTMEVEEISDRRRSRRLLVIQYLLGKKYRNDPEEMSQVSELTRTESFDSIDSDATTDQRETAPSPILPNLGEIELSSDSSYEHLGGRKRKLPPNRILPQLKPVMMKNKKYTYKLKDSPSLRHKAIDEGIRYENKHMNKTKKQAAISKKGRFNILRIYRRNNNLKECNILTKDMEYMDKKYKLGKTSKICSKKKGKNSKKKKSSRRKTQKKKKISKRKSQKRKKFQ